MEHFESFCQLLQEYIDLFDHLIQIEEEKIEAVNKNQITFVENCMNHEQAAVLKLRGLELQREKSLEELGCSGLSFRQIIEKRPDFSPSLRPDPIIPNFYKFVLCTVLPEHRHFQLQPWILYLLPRLQKS